jgi:hypothetical protein
MAGEVYTSTKPKTFTQTWHCFLSVSSAYVTVVCVGRKAGAGCMTPLLVFRLAVCEKEQQSGCGGKVFIVGENAA